MRLQDGFDRYKQDVIVFRNQSRKTEENHDIAARSLINFLGNIELSTLSFEDVRKWKQHLDKGRSAETVRNYIIKLRVVLTYLQRSGIECLNPEAIAVPQRTDKVPDCITKEDVSKLIEAQDSIHIRANKVRNKLIISLLYSSGIRVAELCRLDISDIKDDTFTVVGKGGKARLCFIDERAKGYINEYLKIRTEGYPVYVIAHGKTYGRVRYYYEPDNNPSLLISGPKKTRMTPTEIQIILKNARKNAGLTARVTPHTLRHSFATDLLRNNANIRYVQALLGHANLQTTQMYTHVVNEDLRKVFSQHHTT